jgi:hypothetical protein
LKARAPRNLHLSQRIAGQQPAQQFLALGQRQMAWRAFPGCRPHPARVRQETLDRLRRATHGRCCGREGLAGSNTALNLETICFG